MKKQPEQPDEVSADAQSKEAFAPQDRWQDVAAVLRKKIGATKFRQWIEPLHFDAWQEGCVILSAPTPFYANWVRDNYGNTIKQCWQSLSKGLDKEVIRVDIIVGGANKNGSYNSGHNGSHNGSHNGGALLEEDGKKSGRRVLEKKFYHAYPQSAQPAGLFSSLVQETPLNDNMTFDNFVYGESNLLAYKEALAYTESYMKGQDNALQMPLFISGAIGRGKTHLLHAIGKKLQKQAQVRVMNLSAERFRSNFVSALAQKKMLEFKKCFHNVDVLLMDDMQFLSGTHTQSEFLQILNLVHSQSGLLVMASTKSPNQLDGLDESIRSRLSGGLVVSIYPADNQLRQDIIRAKLRQQHPPLQFPSAMIQLLANTITHNIRELEGALHRIVAHTKHFGKVPDKSQTQLILRDLLQAPQNQIRVKDIQKKTAEYFDISVEDLLSARRQRAIARPRQIAMYLAKQLTPRSLPDIGQRFGGRDHTTVLHALRRIETLCASEPSIHKDVANIKALCQMIKKKPRQTMQDKSEE